MKIIKVLLVAYLLSFVSLTFAEPWIANRYAQNCAGCHAPGRFNLSPSKRRCTLSCQGCHVNPNGGGLRNQYGKWNQDRWLRSFFNRKVLKNKPLPAPIHKQPYHQKKAYKVVKKGKKNYAVLVKKNAIPKLQSLSAAHISNEVAYNKYKDKNWDIEAKDWKTFYSQLPANDPFVLERKELITASGDLRYLFGTGQVDTNGTVTDVDLDFIMNVDFGAKIRPIAKYLSAVIEGRFTSSPAVDGYLENLSDGATPRSAYLLLDELPFNTYIMAGVFRPMFGHYNPDHTALSQRMSGLNQRVKFKALSIGTAPNVPYFNATLLLEKDNGQEIEKQGGVVINAGLRFVTLGASAKLSYWSTQDQDANKRNMYSITMGGSFLGSKLILNSEILRTGRTVNNAYHEGNVYTLESKFRAWRENYLMFNYGMSDVNSGHLEGSASEMLLGLKSFLYPGMELEISFVSKEEEDIPNATKRSSSLFQTQMHLYF